MEIETDRLILRLVPLAGLAATAAKDMDSCRRIIGAGVTEEWLEEAWVAALRLKQRIENPAFGPWSIRAIGLKETGEVIGNINCHHMPMPFQLGDETSLAVEIGYTIFAPWRRRGFAAEAIGGFCGWATSVGVEAIILSIAPGNAASRGLAEKLGAAQIGTNIDAVNGPQDIFYAALERSGG